MRPIAVSCLLLLGLALSGCAGGAGGSARAAGPGEVSMEMFVTGEDHFAVFYQVRSDGTIGFGGGQNAFNRKITWSGEMTEDERTQLLALVRDHDLATTDPPSADKQAVTRYVVRVGADGRRNSFTVHGEPRSLLEIRTLLETAARRRNEDFLETLPRPSIERSGTDGPPKNPG